jgi:hypothetical protein
MRKSRQNIGELQIKYRANPTNFNKNTALLSNDNNAVFFALKI